MDGVGGAPYEFGAGVGVGPLSNGLYPPDIGACPGGGGGGAAGGGAELPDRKLSKESIEGLRARPSGGTPPLLGGPLEEAPVPNACDSVSIVGGGAAWALTFIISIVDGTDPPKTEEWLDLALASTDAPPEEI